MAKEFKDLIWDYLVFLILIVFTVVAPLWNNIRGNNQKKVKSKADYVFATGKVSMFAMMLSVARGALGVRSFIGFPSELYYQGSEMWQTLYGYVCAYPVVCFVFIPVYFNLGITSAYQYLDMRFKSKLVRCLASGLFVVRQVLNLGVTVYTPAVALNTVIGVPYWASLVGITVISIIFNLLGGLKNAIKADVIQTITMIFVTLVIIVQGFYRGGGPIESIKVTKDSGRLNFFRVTGDTTVRVDTLSAWFGQLFISMSLFGCQQNFIQRYLSMPSLRKVTQMMMSNMPLIVVLFSSSWIAGIGIYATYFNCDPLKANFTSKRDEILPFFVEDQFDYLPGFIGLFMATIFNGALAFNVSNLNSIATVTWEDFLSKMTPFKKLKDKSQVKGIKVVGTIYAVLIMGVGFSVGLLSGVIESQMLMTSATTGPLLGTFLLALLFPQANGTGTAVGMISAQMFTTWMLIMNITRGKTIKVSLPTSIEGCTNETFSSNIHKSPEPLYIRPKPLEIPYSGSIMSQAAAQDQLTGWNYFYSTSYMYYSIIGTLLTVTIGIIVSYLTRSDEDAYDSKLIHVAVYKFTNWLPGKKRYYTDDTPSVTNLKTAVSAEIIAHENLAFESEIGTVKSSSTTSEDTSENNKRTSTETFSSLDTDTVTIVPKEIYRKMNVD